MEHSTLILLATFVGVSIFGAVLWLGTHRFCLAPSQAALSSKKQADVIRSIDGRRMKRFSTSSKAQVCWQGADTQHLFKARVVDLSEHGARINSHVAMPLGTPVYIEMRALQLAGTATVRYCAKGTLGYHVGLEFKGPMFRTL